MAAILLSIILVTFPAWSATAQRPADEYCRACGMGTDLNKCDNAYDVPGNLTIDRSICNQISTQPKEVQILCGRYAQGYYLKCFKGTSMFTCQASCGSDVESIGKNLENVNKLMDSGLLASLNTNNQQQGGQGGQARGNGLFNSFPNFGNMPSFNLGQQPDFFNNVFDGFQQPPPQFPTQTFPTGTGQPQQGGTQGENAPLVRPGQASFPANPQPTPLPTPVVTAPPSPVSTPPPVNYPTPPPLVQTQPQLAQGGAAPGTAGQNTPSGSGGSASRDSTNVGQGQTPFTGLTAGGTAGFAGGPRGQFFQSLPQLENQNFFSNFPEFGSRQPPGGFNLFQQPGRGFSQSFYPAFPATVPGQTASGQATPSTSGQSGTLGGTVTPQQGGGAVSPTDTRGQQNLGFPSSGYPQFGGVPQFGGNQSPFGGNQPPFGGNQPQFGGAQGNQPQLGQIPGGAQSFGFPAFAGQTSPAASNASQGSGFQFPGFGGNAQQQGANVPQTSLNPNQIQGFTFPSFGGPGQQGSNFFQFPSQRPPSQQATFSAPYFGGSNQQRQQPQTNTQGQGTSPNSAQRPGFGFQQFPQNSFFSQPLFGGQQGFGNGFPGFPNQGGFGPSATLSSSNNNNNNNNNAGDAGNVAAVTTPRPVAVGGADVSGPVPTAPGLVPAGSTSQPNLGAGGFPQPGVEGNQYPPNYATGGGFQLLNPGENTQIPGEFGVPQTAPAVASGGSGSSGVASSFNPTVTVVSPPEPPSAPSGGASTDSPMGGVAPAETSVPGEADSGPTAGNAAEEPQIPPEILNAGSSGFPGSDGQGDTTGADGGFGDSDQSAGQAASPGSNQQPVDPRFGSSLNDLRQDLDNERNFFNPSQGSAFPPLDNGAQSGVGSVQTRPTGFLGVPSFSNNYNSFRDFDPFQNFNNGNLQAGATENQGSAFPDGNRGSNFGNTAAKDSPVERTNPGSKSDFGDFGDFGSFDANFGGKFGSPQDNGKSDFFG